MTFWGRKRKLWGCSATFSYRNVSKSNGILPKINCSSSSVCVAIQSYTMFSRCKHELCFRGKVPYARDGRSVALQILGAAPLCSLPLWPLWLGLTAVGGPQVSYSLCCYQKCKNIKLLCWSHLVQYYVSNNTTSMAGWSLPGHLIIRWLLPLEVEAPGRDVARRY